MTREEAIKYLTEEQNKTEEVVALNERDFGVSESVWHTEYEAFALAITALREQGDHIRETTKMMRLPCEVGDMMWGIRTYGGKYVQKKKRPECAKVTEMYFGEGMRLCIVLKGLCRGEYGVTVFGSREEAEAALKEEV